jgi:ribosome maturation factor RimP
MSPLLLYFIMSDLKHAIQSIVEKHLPDENHFIVEVKMTEKNSKMLLNILLDSDEGVTIEACARLSRVVSGELEENEIMPDAYTIEVSSPGIDYPLSSERQYRKNIGRELKVNHSGDKEDTGKLLEITAESIKLLVKRKQKGMKATEEELIIPLGEVKKSVVQVSFK